MECTFVRTKFYVVTEYLYRRSLMVACIEGHYSGSCGYVYDLRVEMHLMV